MAVKINRFIGPKEEGLYLEVPFEMPEGVERLKVSYTVDQAGPYKSIVDLGVRDPLWARGWSGGARSGFFIGTEKATPGYRAGELTAGTWSVLLGAYKIGGEGCTVTLTVEFETAGPRWLKGELHAHTVHSDGAHTVQEAEGLAMDAGLDFLALTDHNTTSQNFAYSRESELVFIPGMELTTRFGHCNFYGVEEPCDDFRATSLEHVEAYIRTAKERGAKVSLNHPHCSKCGWLWDFNVDHDWVEIWNGPWREDNEKALNWWQEQLASGRRLVAVGGSDFHREHPYIRHGMPCNWVYAETKTVAGILEAVDRGRVFISFSTEGPMLELKAGAWMMGDTIPDSEAAIGQDLTVVCSGVMPGDIVRLITERGTEGEWTVGEEADRGGMEYRVRMEKRLFYRAEIRRYFHEANGMLLAAACNPIYLR